MSLFWIFLAILIIQRLSELVLARHNEKIVRSMGAVEYDANGYRYIVLMHIAFFISLVSEYTLLGRTLNAYWILLLVLFLLTQILRYWAISTLGHFWNTRILVLPESKAVIKGPYKYIRHPNYLAVRIEIAVIPLLYSCYITAVIFTVLNMLLLRRRIRIEDRALSDIR